MRWNFRLCYVWTHPLSGTNSCRTTGPHNTNITQKNRFWAGYEPKENLCYVLCFTLCCQLYDFSRYPMTDDSTINKNTSPTSRCNVTRKKSGLSPYFPTSPSLSPVCIPCAHCLNVRGQLKFSVLWSGTHHPTQQQTCTTKTVTWMNLIETTIDQQNLIWMMCSGLHEEYGEGTWKEQSQPSLRIQSSAASLDVPWQFFFLSGQCDDRHSASRGQNWAFAVDSFVP